MAIEVKLRFYSTQDVDKWNGLLTFIKKNKIKLRISILSEFYCMFLRENGRG